MRWRKSQSEGVSAEVLRLHNARTHAPSRSIGHHPAGMRLHADPSSLITHRKIVASIYIMCRALITVVQAISSGGGKDGLSEATGYLLEETTFDQFKRPDLKLLSQSINHRTNAELYAKLLGDLADLRYVRLS
jgi:hypothetical protein